MDLPRATYGTGHLNDLTAREVQVLRLKQQGYTDQEAADKLRRGIATIKTHLSKAYLKLGARNGHDAVRLARQQGLLD